MTAMQVSVKLFGPLAQAAGCQEAVVEVDGLHATCRTVREALAAAHSRLAPLLPACRLAVNHRYASEEQVLGVGDEVALIGLVSGG